MKSVFRPAALAALLVLSACYPVSQRPIGTSAPNLVDARLLGAWRAEPKEKKDGPTYVFFIQRKDGLEALMVGAPIAGDNGGWMSFSVKTARLKGQDFISGRTLLDDAKPSKDPNYTPVYYRLDGKNTLRMYALGVDAIEAAIAKGEIRGEVKKLSYGDDVVLTDDGKAIDKFFASHDASKLFTDQLGVFHRLP